MKLTNLARSKSEVKESPSTKIDKQHFGYGTRLRLEKEDLKKLGLKLKNVGVGDVFCGEFEAEVISVSENQSNDYSSSSIELQITKLGLEAEEDDIGSAIDDAIKEAGEDA
jgi:hypothetical protein